MNWQICQCSAPDCAFRFPAAAGAQGCELCPLCGTPTECKPVYSQGQSERTASRPVYPTTALHLLLDNIRSTYNVGSLFRTADGAGVVRMHLCGITPTPDHPKVAKTALGAQQSVPWQYYRNALHAADQLLAAGVSLWALEIHAAARALPDLQIPSHRPLALIIGNENFGVDPALLERCEAIVQLPMLGTKRSLNVASAAAIAVYWLRFAQA